MAESLGKLEDQGLDASDSRTIALKRLRSLRNAFLLILSYVATAAITALVTSYVNRASPSASITEIDISHDFNESERFGKKKIKVPRDDKFFEHLFQSEWLLPSQSIPQPPGHITLKDMVDILVEDQETIDNLLPLFQI